jgi:outer membrane protein insertion porin family
MLAAFNLSWTRNRRDFNQEPAKGDWLRLTLQPSYADITAEGGQNTGSPNLGSTFYGKFSVDYRSYYSKAPRRSVENFDDPRSVLATRVLAGTIVGDPPFTDQFFVGGANGVRGYPEDRFWGNTMFMVQAELRYPIQKSFYAIAFVDYGGAWNGYPGIKDFDQTNTVTLKLGYGLGVNFRTPFGPIRLDLGFDDKGRPRTHFLIGGSF